MTDHLVDICYQKGQKCMSEKRLKVTVLVDNADGDNLNTRHSEKRARGKSSCFQNRA